MIKGIHYYRTFDLADAREAISRLGSDRGTSVIFGDAIQSLLILARERNVSDTEVEGTLGKPDRTRQNLIGVVWEYDWIDAYGDVKYSSSTPFQFQGNSCIGLADEE